jgi:hypothetical protein
MGNPIWDKTQLEGEATLLSFPQMKVQRKMHSLWSDI